ncbi:MAG: TAXI family TRAP transporter solute-binding subunit [Clostridiales Family XIII bacterium]|jgi:TRAP transporter TAXI family solute receptor|nr:TAXI family TRAP transporter solute-binding subunit [Clostridiales Family XIII bacterium]
MKRKQLLIIATMVLMLGMMLASCSGNKSGEESTSTIDTGSRDVQSETEPEDDTIEPMDLVYATNPTGTGYYAIGAGQGGLLSTDTPLNVIVTPSTGPEGIVAAIKAGEAQLAVNCSDHFENYWDDSEGSYTLGNMRTIENGNTLCFALVTNADSGIETVADLKGKRVTFDGLSDTHKQITEAILRAYGLDPNKDVERMKMSFSNSGFTDLAEGRTDACIGSISGSKLEELASKITPKILAVEPEQATEVAAEYSSVVPAQLASDVPGGSKGLPCVGMPTALFCRDDLPEDVVYVITKTLMENYDSLSQICEELREWTNDVALSETARFPYHSGSIKYYKEIGMWNDEWDTWNVQQTEKYAG